MEINKERVLEFAVLVLERVSEDGRTAEHHIEAESLDDALRHAKDAAETLPDWVAITIVHIEDYPRMLEGAEHKGEG